MDIESYRLWLESERERKSELIKNNEELRGCELRVLGLGDYVVSDDKDDFDASSFPYHMWSEEEIKIRRWWRMVLHSQSELRHQAALRAGKVWKTDYYLQQKFGYQSDYNVPISFGAPQSDLFLRFLFLERFQDVNLVEELISFLPFEIEFVYCIVKLRGENPPYYIVGVEGKKLFFLFLSQEQVERKIKISNDPNWKALRKMVSKLLKKRVKINKKFKRKKKKIK